MADEMTERDRAIGAALRRLRLTRGLGLRTVAATTNISASALGAYERSDRVIPATRLGQLCDFYNVGLTELLEPEESVSDVPERSGLAVRFDFDGLANAKSPEAKAAVQVVKAIRQRRSTVRPSDGAIVIRNDDLLIVSAALGLTVDGLAHRLRAEGVLRRPSGRRSNAHRGR